jgi:hypothetical protein
MSDSTISEDPSALFQRRLASRSIPREKVPAKIGDMVVTSELLDDYSGHEIFLKERAKHPPHCYSAYDALRLCLVQKVTDPQTCGRVLEAYRPCAKELQREKVKRMMQLEEERRKILSAKARVLSATEGHKE